MAAEEAVQAEEAEHSQLALAQSRLAELEERAGLAEQLAELAEQRADDTDRKLAAAAQEAAAREAELQVLARGVAGGAVMSAGVAAVPMGPGWSCVCWDREGRVCYQPMPAQLAVPPHRPRTPPACLAQDEVQRLGEALAVVQAELRAKGEAEQVGCGRRGVDMLLHRGGAMVPCV